jgi:hypothetical protein
MEWNQALVEREANPPAPAPASPAETFHNARPGRPTGCFALFSASAAGAAQNKPESLVFDQPMHLIQNLGNFLHFVQDDRLPQLAGGLGQQLLSQQRRALGEFHEQIGQQKIINQALGKFGFQVGRFAGFSRTLQKCRLPGRKVDFEQSFDDFHFGKGSEIVQLFRNILQIGKNSKGRILQNFLSRSLFLIFALPNSRSASAAIHRAVLESIA